jgi:hypothetical protein
MAKKYLTDFISEVRKSGISRSNSFEVMIPVPVGLRSTSLGTSSMTEKITLRCESAVFPPQIVGVKQQRIYGPTYPRPFGVDYGGEGATFTFLLDGTMDVKAFFDAWVGQIVNPFRFNVKYENNYISDIQIFQLAEQRLGNLDGNNIELDDVPYVAVLENAFPRNVNLLQLDYSDQNKAQKLNVTFTFRRWIPFHRNLKEDLYSTLDAFEDQPPI